MPHSLIASVRFNFARTMPPPFLSLGPRASRRLHPTPQAGEGRVGEVLARRPRSQGSAQFLRNPPESEAQLSNPLPSDAVDRATAPVNPTLSWRSGELRTNWHNPCGVLRRAWEEIESPHPEEAAFLGGRLEGWQQAPLSPWPSFPTPRYKSALLRIQSHHSP